MLDLDAFNAQRTDLNAKLAAADEWFAEFGNLDTRAYAAGSIAKANKELIGLAISIVSRCEECVAYHLQEAATSGANKEQMVEAIRIAVVGGGSVCIPTARNALAMLENILGA